MLNSLVHYRRLIFAALLLASAVVLRWPSYERRTWNLDEGSTITMAQMVRAGQVPYLEAADNRTPLVPYAKALILAVAGDWNTWAVHAAVALMLGLTAVLLWQIARRLGQEAVGVFAALVFSLFNLGLLPAVDSFTAHTGWFVIFFSAIGFWFFSAAVTRGGRWPALFSGLAFGLSCLAKQPGLLDFGVSVVIALLLAGFEPGARAARLLPLMVLGFLLPLAGTVLYFMSRGALDDLVFYAWTYNTKYYVPEVPLAQRLAAIRVPCELLLGRMPLALGLCVVAAFGLVWTAFSRLRRKPAVEVLAWLILGWSATGLLSTMLSGRDFAHYSMQLIPGLSLACAWVLAGLWQRAAVWRQQGRRLPSLALMACVALALASFAVPVGQELAHIDTREDYNRELGDLVQAYSRPDERMFVWGYMPELHVHARRLPSTRYFYTNWVTGMIPWTNVDWFKDTTYAIIPGTPELLRQDFERRPPAVIVDTGSRRSYLKYPLRRQSWLWHKVVYEFAEVRPDLANPWGFRVYRRIAAARYGAAFPAEVPVDGQVRIDTQARTASQTTPVKITYPAGTTSIELYKDDELYRRIECPAEQAGAVVFQAIDADLPLGERKLQAVVRGRRTLASAAQSLLVTPAEAAQPNGPVLEFEGRNIRPLTATDINGDMRLLPSGIWSANAPAELTYERPTDLYGIELEYGLDDILAREPGKWKTDGVDVAVHFISASGKESVLFNQHLDARYFVSDQGLQKDRVMLPLNEPGRIAIWISPGHESDASCDWTYIKSVRGIPSPITLAFRDRKISATRIETPLGLTPVNEHGLDVLMVHAPSQIEFPLQGNMHRLTGTFGLLSSAWTGPKGSAGAIFEVWHLPPTGEPKLLHTQLADPMHNPSHRGFQTFSTVLPHPAAGAVRLVTRPAHSQDNAFNYTYWGALTAEEFQAQILTPGEPVRNIEIEARLGYDELLESQRTVLYLHAPSRLVFPLSAGFRRLSGSFGLLTGAYTGTEPSDGSRFTVELEDAAGQRTLLWQQDLDPQNVAGDRGPIPFSIDLPPTASGRLVFCSDARPGRAFTRAWTFWHGLKLEP